jgi:hypothetical protein
MGRAKTYSKRRRLKNRLAESRTSKLRKLSDPKDKDDPRWVKRLVEHLEIEIAKKQKATQHKQEQRSVGGNRRSRQSDLQQETGLPQAAAEN